MGCSRTIIATVHGTCVIIDDLIVAHVVESNAIGCSCNGDFECGQATWNEDSEGVAGEEADDVSLEICDRYVARHCDSSLSDRGVNS